MRLEADGKGYAAVFTCSTRQLVHIMLITGWQVDLFNDPKKGFVLTVYFHSVSHVVMMIISYTFCFCFFLWKPKELFQLITVFIHV